MMISERVRYNAESVVLDKSLILAKKVRISMHLKFFKTQLMTNLKFKEIFLSYKKKWIYCSLR